MKMKNVFDVQAPAGVTVLADGTVAVVSRLENSVKIFTRTGSPLPCPLRGHRGFDKPTNILRLSNGRIVVRDQQGLQLFSQHGEFIKPIGCDYQNRYYGLAEDSDGNILTINVRDSATASGLGTRTVKGQSDVFYFSQDGSLLKQMELEDLVATFEEDYDSGERGR